MYIYKCVREGKKKKEKTDDTEVLSQEGKGKSARGQKGKRNQEVKWLPVKLLITEVKPQAQFPMTVSGIIYSLLL